MELVEIKQGLLEIVPQLKALRLQPGNGDKVRRLMGLFLRQVLGYDEQEIVSEPVRPGKVRAPIQFGEQIKFMLQAVPPQVELNQAVLEKAIDYALGARVQLFVLTNGIQFVLYDIDTASGQIEVEAVAELNLLTDDAEQIAISLWPICQKDCGKKVILNTSRIEAEEKQAMGLFP